MKLESNGRSSAGKRSRHINIRYFFIADMMEKKHLDIQYCPTDKVLQYLVDGSTNCKDDGDSGDDSKGQERENRRLRRRSDLMNLIGTFDLDPNRVLDLTLDVLEGMLYPLPDGSTTNGTFNTNNAGPKPVVTPSVRWLLDVMHEFALDKLPPLIAFKLTSDHRKMGMSDGSSFCIAVVHAVATFQMLLVQVAWVRMVRVSVDACMAKASVHF
ncbi:MAG: hypothetical protein SGILL_000653 [Bacillariaceae sp.]